MGEVSWTEVLAAFSAVVAAGAGIAAWRTSRTANAIAVDAAGHSNAIAAAALDATRQANEIAERAAGSQLDATKLQERALEAMGVANAIADRALAVEESRDKSRRAAVAARLETVLGLLLRQAEAALIEVDRPDSSHVGANSTLQALAKARDVLTQERDRPDAQLLGAYYTAELASLFDEAFNGYHRLIRPLSDDPATRRREILQVAEAFCGRLHGYVEELRILSGGVREQPVHWEERLAKLRSA